jgi:hypothetical protein
VSAAAEVSRAEEARSMLARAVTALKQDPERAINRFNDPLGTFRSGDIYVFCAALDGKIVAHANPALIGRDIRGFEDRNGTRFGSDIMDEARENMTSEVTYRFPRPTGGEPVWKSSYVTRVGNLVCGVGFYPFQE